MKAQIFTLDLSFRRKSLIGYSVGMALYVLMVVALYPSFKDNPSLDSFTEQSPQFAALFGITGSLTSPTGWLNANIYGNFFPLVILLVTVGYGGAFCLAGQEEDGRLELVLSLPVARWGVVMEKVGVLVTQATVVSIVVLLSCFVGRFFELDVDAANLTTATIGVLLLGIDFGLLAMVIGGATGERGLALGVASAVASVSYLVSSMAPLVDWLSDLKYLSLFYWAIGDGQLDQGLTWAATAVLVGVGVILTVVAVRLFARHDLT